MGFLDFVLDPANIFGQRDGGVNLGNAIDPGGAIVEAGTGSDLARRAADLADVIPSATTDPASSTYAADTWADITRMQWDDYDQRFIPKEDELIGMLSWNNPDRVQGALAKGMAAAEKGFDATQQLTEQYRSRYGMAMSPGAGENQQRRSAVQRTAAQVGAANQTRQAIQDQDRQIALGMGNNAVTAAGEYK